MPTTTESTRGWKAFPWESYALGGKRQRAALREEKVFLDQRQDHTRRDTPVVQVNRADPDELFSLKRKHFSHAQAEALGWFLKQSRKSEWMQKQKGYIEKAALAVSSFSTFDGLGFCFCRPSQLCGEEDHCPRCHLEERIKPVLQEYGDVFGKADYWFAAVPSLSYRPGGAGLHYVTRKDAQGRAQEYRHLRPFAGGDERRGLTLDTGDFDSLVRLLKAPFQFAQLLCSVGLADGAYAVHEVDLQFIPQSASGLKVGEILLPHGNILFNTHCKPDWRFAQDCWLAYTKVWERFGLLDLGYPDLVIGKSMVDQAEINRWISYGLKPLPFEKFYFRGLRNGCPVEPLNMHFDQTVFRALKVPLQCVRSPRKYGNLNSDPKVIDYIGARPPNRTLIRIRRKIAKCLKNTPEAEPYDRLAQSELEFLFKLGFTGRKLRMEDVDTLETRL
jgi:hypothetical protein